MISLEAAQSLLLSMAVPMPLEHVALVEAHGRWLGAPLVARRSQPWADLSSMDGYALAPGIGPWHISHPIPAQSRNAGTLVAGQAARIFTGAPLPMGADRILAQEDAVVSGTALSAKIVPQIGEHIRRAASDFAQGEMLASKGTRVSTALVALAALAGHGQLTVHRRPEMTIVSTGSELIHPGSDDVGLPSSNGPMLLSMAIAAGATVKDGGIFPDNLREIQLAIEEFEQSSSHGSILVFSGGASVGDHDLVVPALEASGWTICAHKISMKPGKPLIIARKADLLALGLPGNPVSAYVTATLFLLPYLRAIAGCPNPLPRLDTAPLATPLSAGGTRTEFLRGQRHSDGSVSALPSQDSAGLKSLAAADILIRREIAALPQDIGAIATFITIA